MIRGRNRRVVVSYVHGEVDGLKEILVHAGRVNRRDSWVGVDTIMIQTGDVTDTGTSLEGTDLVSFAGVPADISVRERTQ